jgi:GrpB-like predicted nucleotidyltransferase (UPF0157 family)
MTLEVGTVKLEEYTSKWNEMYKEEKHNLKRLLGKYALSIEHIGSTSIVGLKAKPIVDIGIGVEKLQDFELIKDKFTAYPYSYKLDYDNDEVLIRKHDNDFVTHLIHVMRIDGERYKNTILFRNYLSNHSDVLKDYQNLKEQLAKKYANERKKYTASKNDFIQQVLKKAKDETI